VTNHSARSHMATDLHRYLFAASFAKVTGRTPFLGDFPEALLPEHLNVEESLETKKFKDRFRVQLGERPATTVVAHISKDGHYFIHYDPSQCRSLTVREAARLQTFPDNYHFEGGRTEQYRQVGNAVPPLLARQIAEVGAEVFGLSYEGLKW
jgi:DNA (cytosine-5)-methyltransferase 1